MASHSTATSGHQKQQTLSFAPAKRVSAPASSSAPLSAQGAAAGKHPFCVGICNRFAQTLHGFSRIVRIVCKRLLVHKALI
jgi:hypothetical protein